VLDKPEFSGYSHETMQDLSRIPRISSQGTHPESIQKEEPTMVMVNAIAQPAWVFWAYKTYVQHGDSFMLRGRELATLIDLRAAADRLNQEKASGDAPRENDSG
jgi:hypothetical protein